MNEADGLLHSLAGMGFIQLGLAFIGLAAYALALNGALGSQPRLMAAMAALVAGGGFAAMTDPWVYGVVLVALAIASMGVFVATAWAISALCELAMPAVPTSAPAFEDSMPAAPEPVATIAGDLPTTTRPAPLRVPTTRRPA